MKFTKGYTYSTSGSELRLNRRWRRTTTLPGICLLSNISVVALALIAAATSYGQVINPPTRPGMLPSWTQLFPTSAPSARAYTAMTYDPVSQKIVMFGGFDQNQPLGDTWTFDGTTWSQVRTHHAPPARALGQMAYDAATQKVVLFGGFDGTNYLGDTWLWDGATSKWKEAHPHHSPPAVTGPMLFTDPNGSVDEFGGFNKTLLTRFSATMWQWQGSDWVELHPPTLPYPRSSAVIGVNQATKQVMLFGGLGEVNPVNTWTYNGTTWRMRSPDAQPLWVYGGSGMSVPAFNGVVQFGGANSGIAQNSSWLWTGQAWKELPVTQLPPPREGAGSAYDPVLGHSIIFGGLDGETLLGDTWELTP